MSKKHPLVIEIEGTDGSGKTTAVKQVVEELRGRGLKVLETREVGSPIVPGMADLRKIILNPELNMSGVAMEFVFAAMRVESQRFYDTVADQYDVIVSDRGWLSHLAYTEHNVSAEFVETFYMGIVKKLTRLPDVVVYLSISQETAKARRVKRGLPVDAIEAKGETYLGKVMATFETLMDSMTVDYLAGSSKTLLMKVDANPDLATVRGSITEISSVLAALATEKKGTQDGTVDATI